LLHPCQHLFLFLKIAIPSGVRQNLSVYSFDWHFFNREVEHLICLLVICVSSLKIPCSIHVLISSLGFVFKIFLLGYVCCTWGFIVTIPNRLLLYIG
jgi:hypothetical protein